MTTYTGYPFYYCKSPRDGFPCSTLPTGVSYTLPWISYPLKGDCFVTSGPEKAPDWQGDVFTGTKPFMPELHIVLWYSWSWFTGHSRMDLGSMQIQPVFYIRDLTSLLCIRDLTPWHFQESWKTSPSPAVSETWLWKCLGQNSSFLMATVGMWCRIFIVLVTLWLLL